MNAQELRYSTKKPKPIPRNSIYIIADNVYDTYNIGAIFRIADAVAAKEVLLCGDSETPPNIKIKRASINTTEFISWKYFKETLEAVKYVKKKNPKTTIVAIEQDDNAITYDVLDSADLPMALIVGNETRGVSQEVLDVTNFKVMVPMHGYNNSLNCHVALALVAYHLLEVVDYDD